MFNDIADKVHIDQAFPQLAGIHQALFADPVDPVRDPGGFLIDIIDVVNITLHFFFTKSFKLLALMRHSIVFA